MRSPACRVGGGITLRIRFRSGEFIAAPSPVFPGSAALIVQTVERWTPIGGRHAGVGVPTADRVDVRRRNQPPDFGAGWLVLTHWVISSLAIARYIASAFSRFETTTDSPLTVSLPLCGLVTKVRFSPRSFRNCTAMSTSENPSSTVT